MALERGRSRVDHDCDDSVIYFVSVDRGGRSSFVCVRIPTTRFSPTVGVSQFSSRLLVRTSERLRVFRSAERVRKSGRECRRDFGRRANRDVRDSNGPESTTARWSAYGVKLRIAESSVAPIVERIAPRSFAAESSRAFYLSQSEFRAREVPGVCRECRIQCREVSVRRGARR